MTPFEEWMIKQKALSQDVPLIKEILYGACNGDGARFSYIMDRMEAAFNAGYEQGVEFVLSTRE